MNRTSLGKEMREIALECAEPEAAEKAGTGRVGSGGGKVIQGKR